MILELGLHCQLLTCNELERKIREDKTATTVSKQKDFNIFVLARCFDNATVGDLYFICVCCLLVVLPTRSI